MAITKFGSLVPYGGPVIRREILASSITVTVSDSVTVDTSGFIALGTAGTTVFGHVMQIGTNKGVGLETTGIAGAETGSFVGTFLTASDNEAVGKVRGEIDASQMTLYAADPATGIFGTTTGGSEELGTYFNLTNEESIDETTVSDATQQYFSWGLHPAVSNQIVVNIFESQVFNTAG